MSVNVRVRLFVAAIVGGSLGVQGAFAQTASATSVQDANGPPEFQEIVVTALRQSTLLSKTPVTMRAVSGDDLRGLGITDSRTLSDVVPNVSLTGYNGGVIIQIRGISSSDTTEKGDPSAAFLSDGIYIARPQDQVGAFYDVERVEALRGPQGTLYGRNTTAGVINVITVRPKYDYEGSVDTQFGNLGTVNATGVMNVPVGTTLGLRLAVNDQRQDNYIDTGGRGEDINPGRDTLSTRLSFGGEIGSRFRFVMRADYSRDRGSDFNTLPLTNFFPGKLVKGTDPQYVDIGSSNQRRLPSSLEFPVTTHTDRFGFMGEVSYDMDWAELTYLGSYRHSKNESRDDGFFAFGQTPETVARHSWQQSHELRLAFGKDQPLHGQAGLYYFRESAPVDLLIGPPLATLFGGPGATGFEFRQSSVGSKSKAAFGQLTYDLTPSLHLTGGLRYTEDHKERFGANRLLYGLTAVPISANTASKDFVKTTWRAGVDYDVTNLGLLYASVATGYKAGGFNDGCIVGTGPGCAADPHTFYYNPETLTAYEAGLKFRLSRAVQLNGAVFHYDYSNLQLTQVVVQAGNPASLTRNAGRAQVDGAEIESVITLTSWDRVDLSGNYLHARYTDFVPDATFPTATDPLNFNGRLLNHAPKWSGIVGYTHTLPIGQSSNVELAGRVRFSSAYYLQDLNNLSQFRQPSYTKSEITLGYNGDNNRWYLQGYVNNIENQITLAYANSGLLATAGIEEPRTFGVRAGAKF